MADQQPEHDEIKRGDTITVGDISGSVAAIGAGAKVVYSNIERALTEVEVGEQAARAERERLAQSLRTYIERLHRQAERTNVSATASPYRALLSYDFGDAALFYGRGRAIDGLLDRLNRAPLTVLHADSGAGKTSLLRAGIMPRLLAAGDVPLYIRPYQTPAQYAIKRGLLVQLEQTPELRLASLHDFLRHTSNLLGDQRLVILLDQFEELFTYQRRGQRDDFIEELAPCLDDDTLPVSWLFSLRGEWFTQLGTFRPQIKSPFANEYLLQALSAEEAREVITAPARLVNVSYEDDLLDTLISDLGDQAIAPPQLQLVCSALYESRDEGKNTITSDVYGELGGTRGILRSHLDRVLSRHVPPEQRVVARQILEALVSSDRRRILRTEDDLSRELQVLGVENIALSQALQVLIDSRLLRVEEIEDSSEEGELAYELAHDYLIDEIELDPATQARKAAQELLEQQVEIYRRHKTLLGADELVILEAQGESLVVDDKARTLIEASQKKLARERRIFAVGIGSVVILLVLGVISVLAAVGAAVARNDAQEAEAAAERRIEASSVAIEQLFTETGIIKLGGTPNDLTVLGSSVWVTLAEDDLLYRADSTTGIVDGVLEFPGELIAIDGGDESISDGQTLWAITRQSEDRESVNAVHQIDPRSAQIIQTINVGANPSALAQTLQDVWVITADDQTIQHIDIATGQVVDGTSLGAQPTDIVRAKDLLWISTNSGELLVYDPALNQVVDRMRLAEDLHLGPLAWDGEVLWVARQPDVYSRIDVNSRSVIDSHTLRRSETMEPISHILSLVWDGHSMWLKTEEDFGRTGSIFQLDPETGMSVLRAADADLQSGRIAAGADGDLWQLVPVQGALRHIDTQHLDFVASPVNLGAIPDRPQSPPIAVGAPQDIVVDGEEMLIGDSLNGMLLRYEIDPLEFTERRSLRDPQHLTWDGEAVWAASTETLDEVWFETYPLGPAFRKILRVDLSSGDILAESEDFYIVNDMVWGGDSLWISVKDEGIVQLDSDARVVNEYPMGTPGHLTWTGESLVISDLGSFILQELDPTDGSMSTFTIIGGCGATAIQADDPYFWVSGECQVGIGLYDYQNGELGPVLGYIQTEAGPCMKAIQRLDTTVWLLDCTGDLWSLNIRSLELIFEASR